MTPHYDTGHYWTVIVFYVVITPITVVLANIPIDNGLVDEPTVVCGSSAVAVTLRTRGAYAGRVFVKGYSQDRNCQALGDARRYGLSFSVNFEQCGLTRTRELSGVSITTTVVVSFHPIFITKVDRAYRVNCFYTERRRESVSQSLGVDAFTTRAISLRSEAPTCRYDILSRNASGPPVKYAKIGDLIYHKWTCVAPAPNVYCMRVHSCAVNDGQGGLPFYVLDENGCESDGYVFQNLYYVDDLTAGQYAYVFKFADRPTLHFNCQVELTLKPSPQRDACRAMQPKCSPDSGYRTQPSVISPLASNHGSYGTSNGNSKPSEAVYGTKTTINYDLNLQTATPAASTGYGSDSNSVHNNVSNSNNNTATNGYSNAGTYDTYSTPAAKSAAYSTVAPVHDSKVISPANSVSYGSSNINPSTPANTPPPAYSSGYGSDHPAAYGSSTTARAALRQFRLNGAKYRLNNNTEVTTPPYTPILPYSIPSAVQPNPAPQPPVVPYSDPAPALAVRPVNGASRIPADLYAHGRPNQFMFPAGPTPGASPPTPTTPSLSTTAAPAATIDAWTPTGTEPEFLDESVAPISIDPLYMDEMDAFIRQSAPAVDFVEPSGQFARQRIQKREDKDGKQRGAVVVSDMRMPERSLVVVDIDENTLAQQLLNGPSSESTQRTQNATISAQPDSDCVSYAFFIAFSLANALVAAAASALLAALALNSRVSARRANLDTSSTYGSAGSSCSGTSESGVYDIPQQQQQQQVRQQQQQQQFRRLKWAERWRQLADYRREQIDRAVRQAFGT